MRLEDLALIGNCQHAALVHRTGEVAWSCLPRFDSPPVFGALLDPAMGGSFFAGAPDGAPGEPRYLDNTNVLETTFRTQEGAFRVVDFAPRFVQSGRSFRPPMLVRILEPLLGTPRVSVRCDPRLGWSGERPVRVEGSHHVAWLGFESELRLTTDLPMSYLDRRPFALTGRRHLVLTWGEPPQGSIEETCARFLQSTIAYWTQWVKHCNVPPLFQEQVIRSALALKLHCFEDTGAIVAATTTSIPEFPGSGRNWDYRHCWLRDAYYVLAAFRRLGHFEERERFTAFLIDVAQAAGPELDLAPLHRIDGSSDLAEVEVPGWRGHEGSGPVRVGNAAALQRQHDVYGEMVLALAPVFLDARFRDARSPHLLHLLLALARKAARVAGTHDSGIWELRGPAGPESFSTLTCWAAADRAARVLRAVGHDAADELAAEALRIGALFEREAWSAERGSFVSRLGGGGVDASLLHVALLRFLPAHDPRLRATIDGIRDALSVGPWLFRYREDDGLGRPAVPFTTCTFWHAEALAATGRSDEALRILDSAGAAASPLGLFSEDYDPSARRLWGNYPQAYSHASFLNAAFAASPPWADVT